VLGGKENSSFKIIGLLAILAILGSVIYIKLRKK